MKKALFVLLTLSLVLTFSCKKDAGTLSVDQVSPSDLADYTDNGIDPSADGAAELAAAAMAGSQMSGVIQSWINADPDLSAYMPPGASAFGLTRAINTPSDDDFASMMTAMDQGGDFSISASIVDESIDFSDYGEAGSLTLNASISASGDISDATATSGTDTISGKGNFSLSGTSIDAGGVTLAAVALNLAADVSVVHTYDASSESVSANVNSALVYAFSLSDLDLGSGSIAPSGKYIYTLTMNEKVNVDTNTQDVDASATISLVIYDNSDTEIASYTFDADDLDAMAANL